MTDFSWVPALLWGVALAAGFWPGVEQPRALDRPKKGYWTVGTVFWPLRKAYHDLWPYHAVLEKGLQHAWSLAVLIAVVVSLAVNFLHVFKSLSTGWIMVEVAVVAFLLGRASGFWSADRRIIKAQQAEKATDAKA